MIHKGRNIFIIIAGIAAVFIFELVSVADIVTLKNGRVIEGVPRQLGENLEIKTRTAKFIVPRSTVRNIEKKEYNLHIETGPELTPEQIRRQKALRLFNQAQSELDRLNTSRAIALLKEAVEQDPTFAKGLEKLVKILANRMEYKEAKHYLDRLEKLTPLTGDLKALAEKIETGYRRQIEEEQRAGATPAAQVSTFTGIPPQARIPQAPPAADYAGAYYIEYSMYAQIKQTGGIASVAIYHQKPNAPSYQFPAAVKGNYIVPDLSRINPAIPSGSVFATMGADGKSYSLYYKNTLIPLVGKRIMSREELLGVQNLISGNPSAALPLFREASQKDPTNSHVLFGFGRALMLSGKPNDALAIFQKVGRDANFTRYFFMKKLLCISTNYCEAKIKSAQGLNAIDDYEAAIRQFPLRAADFAPFTGVIERGELFSSYTSGEAKKLIPPFAKPLRIIQDTQKKTYCLWPSDGSLKPASMPKLGNYLTLARLLILRSRLASFEDRFNDALLDARRLVRMGQQLNNGNLVIRLVGSKIEKMGTEAFRQIMCNLKTPQQADTTMMALNELIALQPPSDYESMVSYEREEWPIFPKTLFSESALRARIDLVSFSMLPVACAAKKFFLNNHQWPASIAMLIPDYLNKPPLDPFGRDAFKVFPYPGGFRIYSIGPDRMDNNGSVLFNPANGLNSSGDILMDIR